MWYQLFMKVFATAPSKYYFDERFWCREIKLSMFSSILNQKSYVQPVRTLKADISLKPYLFYHQHMLNRKEWIIILTSNLKHMTRKAREFNKSNWVLEIFFVSTINQNPTIGEIAKCWTANFVAYCWTPIRNARAFNNRRRN